MHRYIKARMSVKNIQQLRRAHIFKSPAQNINKRFKARDSVKTRIQHVMSENKRQKEYNK